MEENEKQMFLLLLFTVKMNGKTLLDIIEENSEKHMIDNSENSLDISRDIPYFIIYDNKIHTTNTKNTISHLELNKVSDFICFTPHKHLNDKVEKKVVDYLNTHIHNLLKYKDNQLNNFIYSTYFILDNNLLEST